MDRAETWLQRAIGLLARPHIHSDEGIWLDDCSAIHTIGMREAIDVIFVDVEHIVIRLCPNVPEWRLALWCYSAHAVIELGAGALHRADLMPGDRLELVAV